MKIRSILTGVCLALVLSTQQAHSANGGSIQVLNNTDKYINVTWSAWGCAGVIDGLTLVCKNVELFPGAQHRYTFLWGVTTQWINVGLKTEAHQNFDGKETWHPCSISGDASYCLANHLAVDTDSHETDVCEVKEHKLIPPYPPNPPKVIMDKFKDIKGYWDSIGYKEKEVITYSVKCHRR